MDGISRICIPGTSDNDYYSGATEIAHKYGSNLIFLFATVASRQTSRQTLTKVEVKLKAMITLHTYKSKGCTFLYYTMNIMAVESTKPPNLLGLSSKEPVKGQSHP